MWIKEYADDEEEVRSITDVIFEEYLLTERWEMAKSFYEICLKSNKLCDADRILCKINCWQCYKWIGKYDDIKGEMERLDLSAYKPVYTMGILALQEKFTRFFEIYDRQEEIGEEQLREWPLFRELRQSEEYIKRYPSASAVEETQVEEIECLTEEVINE